MNEYYYRYDVEWYTVIVGLISMIIVYVCLAYKVVRILYEVVVQRLLAALYSANLTSSQKTLKILDSIKDSYITLILVMVCLKIYLLAFKMVGETEFGEFSKVMVLLFVAFAVVDGPNIIQKLTGVDAGLSSGMGKMIAGVQATRMASHMASRGVEAARELFPRYDKNEQVAGAVNAAAQSDLEGTKEADLQVQLDFLVMELEGGEATCHRLLISKCGSYENFKNISDVEKATRVFEECFERAGKPNYPRRIQAAKGYYEKYKNMSTPTVPGDTAGTVAPGIAGTINRSERMKWLFPNGTPKSAAQMQQYLVTITVPIVSSKGAESTMTLRVHKKLANEYIAIFKEMKAIGFPVRASDTAAYVWRTMATNGSKISYHSYGSVVDLNWNSNPLVYHGTGAYRPGSDPYSVTQQVVNIWKKHGFYWGGDWKSYKDYMHFTYTNN